MQGPRLYRFFNYEQQLYLPAPTGGLNTDAHPWELAANQAAQLDNFLIKPGKIVMRNPFYCLGSHAVLGQTYISPVSAIIVDIAAGGSPEGLMILAGRANSSSLVVDPWNAVLLKGGSGNLAQPLTTIAQVRLGNTLGSTVASLSKDAIPGPRWVNFNGLVYAISYGSAGALISDANSNYSIPPLSLMTMPASQNPGTYAPTLMTGAPHGSFDVKGYQQRLWMLGGVDTPAGLTVHEPVTLYWTRPLGDASTPALGSPLGVLTTDWKDPVSGATNKVQMDGDFGDYGVGLAVVRNGLVIFRRNSIWLLKGSTSANYTLVPLSQEVGCVDARSIVETDHGVYFISHRGLMLTNGTTVADVSGAVSRNLAAAILAEQSALHSLGGWITCARTSQGQIMVSIGEMNDVGGPLQMAPLWSGMYDPNIKGGAWTRHTSTIWTRENLSANTLPPLLVWRKGRQQLYAVGDTQITELENEGRQTVIMGSVALSFLVRQSSDNVFADYTAGGTFTDTIPAVWQTRLIPVNVTKRKLGIPLRYYFDYTFGWGGAGTASAPSGWRTTPFNASGANLDTAQTWPRSTASINSQGDLIPNPVIQRVNHDWSPEIEDMYFVVDYANTIANGTYLSVGLAEVYGIGMEYQNTGPVR